MDPPKVPLRGVGTSRGAPARARSRSISPRSSPNLTSRLGLPNVASKLPPSIVHLKVLNSKQIKAVQDIGKALKGLSLLVTILVPLLYALAIFLARGYCRRTLMTVGIAFVGPSERPLPAR